jgi:hypothetical protein
MPTQAPGHGTQKRDDHEAPQELLHGGAGRALRAGDVDGEDVLCGQLYGERASDQTGAERRAGTERTEIPRVEVPEQALLLRARPTYAGRVSARLRRS